MSASSLVPVVVLVALLWGVYALARRWLKPWFEDAAFPKFRVLRQQSTSSSPRHHPHPRRFTSPRHYGLYALVCLGLPLVIASWAVHRSSLMVGLTALGLGCLGGYYLFSKPRGGGGWCGSSVVERLECLSQKALMLFTLCTMVIIVILLGLLLEKTLAFFAQVPVLSFLGGTTWAPTASGLPLGERFGALPLLWGTSFITLIALCLTVPVGMMAAIYLSLYAHPTTRNILKPALETMAGIPTVVYGFFAAITVAPALQTLGSYFGIAASSQSAAAAGLVLGVMLMPMFVSLGDDILSSIPAQLSQGSLGLGATMAETVWCIVVPAAKPSLISALLLTLSRALGETMLVVMAAGLTANLTVNPFASVTTFTVQIVSLLTGDQDFASPETLAAYALGVLLFVVTFILNLIAARFQRSRTLVG